MAIRAIRAGGANNVYDSSYNDDENSDDSGDDQRLTFRFRNFSVSRLLPIFLGFWF